MGAIENTVVYVYVFVNYQILKYFVLLTIHFSTFTKLNINDLFISGWAV